jgi:trans-aconitate 2-methyltransferase
MTTWDPAQYLRFGNERFRPALDLIARISLEAPEVVYDLGCGTGSATAALKGRWPSARVVGVDGSSEMLERAREGGGGIEWERADLRTWRPDEPCDLLFSNAALQWVGGHEELFPRLLGYLKPEGVLAVQMPNNFGAPTHTTIAETVNSPRWRDKLEPHTLKRPVLEPTAYYDMLSRHGARVDMWETTYYHVLRGDDPVVEWTKGSFLRPLLAQLEEGEAREFLGEYAARVRGFYPRRADGTTVMAFKRLFFVAVR